MGKLRISLHLTADDTPEETLELVRTADRGGVKAVYCLDSQFRQRDAYITVALWARATKNLIVGPSVTNTVTRDPSVVARAFQTLNELAPGRIVLGLGPGDSAVRTQGKKPKKLVDFKTDVALIRQLMSGQWSTLNGQRVRMESATGPVPIYVAGSGPRILQLAGEIADGVFICVGGERSAYDWALENLKMGASRAGRDITKVNLILEKVGSMDENRQVARDAVKPYLARLVTHAVPPKVVGLSDEYVEIVRQHYDYMEHFSVKAKHGSEISEELVDRLAIAGTPEDFVRQMKSIEKSMDGTQVNEIFIPIFAQNKKFFMDSLVNVVIPALK